MSEQNKIFRFLEVVTDYAYMNILWLFFSLPIITFFPATTALFRIIRKRANGEEIPILKSFFHYFKKDFKKGVLFGSAVIFVSVMLVGDFLIIVSLENPWQSVLLPILIVITLLFLMVTVYFIPLCISYPLSFKHLLSMAFGLSIRRPIRPVLVICLFVLLAVLTLYTKFFTILLVFSICSWIQYKLIQPAIEKIVVA
ncbi:YesL family protein [Neobacillus niacini]|uniref:YesL family protein n=1 Tax=Neobacillus niacini TaxID=86668 RepID=UPI0005EED7BD|nr:DUF624 domain-containing protein [Neobacillus niacini]